MSASGYYRSHGHYGPSTTAGHGLPMANMYNSNVNLIDCEIPDQLGALGNDQPWAMNSGTAVNQKLDRLLKLMEDQKNERAIMKSDISSLKGEVKEVRAIANAATMESLKTPQSKKLPTELSVSSIP